ncbi:MAG: hypothetical protein IRZ32_17685 [Solirubrobacteraceae bacterium]|jgi:hypothetical protein|nr:hypothetical protein [Solirubrobacteraceae bacterium]
MSVLSTILAATEASEETSKAPFYIVGLALAAWAVIIGIAGMVRPNLPSTSGPARLMVLVTVLLVAGTMSTAIITA